jgi:hypothetical protein
MDSVVRRGLRLLRPPAYTFFYDDWPVASITRAPDGRFFLALVGERGTRTVIIEAIDLLNIEVRLPD